MKSRLAGYQLKMPLTDRLAVSDSQRIRGCNWLFCIADAAAKGHSHTLDGPKYVSAFARANRGIRLVELRRMASLQLVGSGRRFLGVRRDSGLEGARIHAPKSCARL